MARRLALGAALVFATVLLLLAIAPTIHAPGDADCSSVHGENPGEATVYDHDTAMGVDASSEHGAGNESNGATVDCPADDASGMGSSAD